MPRRDGPMKGNHYSVDIASSTPSVLGEGPAWDSDRAVLWWVDIERSRLHSFDPKCGTTRSLRLSSPASSVVVTQSGGLLLAFCDRIAELDLKTSQLQTLAQLHLSLPVSRLNDGKCDPAGRYWIGSLSLEAAPSQSESLYVFDLSHGLRQVLSDVRVSNGIAWSTNCRVMYYIDSCTKTVDAFDYDLETGAIGSRRVVFDVPQELGAADGMTIDSEDRLWVAFWGGGCVVRIDPVSHAIEGIIHLPVTHVTSCAFGGDALNHLYITTARYGLSPLELREQSHAGDLFVADVGVCGLPSTLFRRGSKRCFEEAAVIDSA